MAGMITRCPKCATAFRISEAHLQSAKGMVRCGNCLAVFNARENIQVKSASKPGPTKATSTTAKPIAQTPARAVDASKRKPDAPAVTPTTTPTKLTTPTKTAAVTPIAEPRPQPQAQTPPPEANPKPAPIQEPPAKEIKRAAGIFDGDDTEHETEEDESWALELLKDDSDLNIKLKKIVTPEDKKPAAEPLPIIESHELEPPSAQISFDLNEALDSPTPSQKPVRDMIAAIEAEPLEVAWEDQPSRVKKRVLWWGLTFIAALALVGQIAWLEFYRLSKLEPYRSGYALVCPMLGCELPELLDRNAIKTSKLIVRSHPTQNNALLVDVIIQNNAQFEQSFPGLVLTFTDMQDQPVATRRFTPKDYLGGELAGITQMPVKQPIHVGFEIQDPGGKTLSYNIRVVD